MAPQPVAPVEPARPKIDLIPWSKEIEGHDYDRLWQIAEKLCPPDGVVEKDLAPRLNLLFLAIQHARLVRERDELKASAQRQFERPWLKEANAKLLKMKEESLDYVQQARKELMAKPEGGVVFDSFADIFEYAVPRERRLAIEEAGGFVPGGLIIKNPGERGLPLYNGPGFLDRLGQRGDGEGPFDRHLLRLLGPKRQTLATWCRPVRLPENPKAASAAVRRFLEKLGADTKDVKSGGTSLDLSARFHPPLIQGKTKACAAFAIASDLETHPNVPQLSPGLAYYCMSGGRDVGVKSLPDSLDALKKNGLCTEKECPFDPKGVFPKEPERLPNRRFGVGKWEGVEGTPTAGDLKALLKAGHPIIATISTEGRRITENWIRPVRGGDFSHVINVVGYGSGIDPVDGRTKDYFIVRDSMTPMAGIHYRIAASQLVPEIEEMYRVTEAVIRDP